MSENEISLTDLQQNYVDVIVKCILGHVRNEGDQVPVPIEELDFTLRLTGETWNGQVDARIGKFVYDLDKSIRNAVKQIAGKDAPKLPKGFLKVELKEGSAFLKFLFNSVTKAIEGMDSGHKAAVLITAIAVSGGVLGIGDWAATEQQAIAQSEDADEQVTIREAVASVKEMALSMTQKKEPIRVLVNGMTKDDRIELPGENTAVTKTAAKSRFIEAVEPPVLEQHRDNIDFHYIVTNLDMEPSPWVATFKYGQHNFEAELIITDAELTEFNKLLATKKNAAEEISIDVQVSVLHNDERILSAEVQGLGSPRSGSKRLSELPYLNKGDSAEE